MPARPNARSAQFLRCNAGPSPTHRSVNQGARQERARPPRDRCCPALSRPTPPMWGSAHQSWWRNRCRRPTPRRQTRRRYCAQWRAAQRRAHRCNWNMLWYSVYRIYQILWRLSRRFPRSGSSNVAPRWSRRLWTDLPRPGRRCRFRWYSAHQRQRSPGPVRLDHRRRLQHRPPPPPNLLCSVSRCRSLRRYRQTRPQLRRQACRSRQRRHRPRPGS